MSSPSFAEPEGAYRRWPAPGRGKRGLQSPAHSKPRRAELHQSPRQGDHLRLLSTRRRFERFRPLRPTLLQGGVALLGTGGADRPPLGLLAEPHTDAQREETRRW